MIEHNQAEFDKSNILKWRSEGYTGKGVNIVVLDDNASPYPKDNIIEPLKHLDTAVYGPGHKSQVCSVVREVLPEANIYAFYWLKYNRDKIIAWIKEHKDIIDVITCSLDTSQGGYDSLMELKDLNIPLLIAVGNNSKPYGTLTSSLPFAFGIGGWGEHYDRRAVMSNYGLHLDFMAYTGIYYVSETSNREVQFYGTSCSAQYCAAIIGMYAEWFRMGNKMPMNTQECFEFLLKNVDDKDEAGRDDNSGYGLIRLPDKIPTFEKPIEPPIIIEPEKEIDIMEFKDIGKHWAKQEIEFITEKGLMQGYPDGTFQPDRALTRAEYATMKAKELGFVKKK